MRGMLSRLQMSMQGEKGGVKAWHPAFAKPLMKKVSGTFSG
jgi:hypothetical protein